MQTKRSNTPQRVVTRHTVVRLMPRRNPGGSRTRISKMAISLPYLSILEDDRHPDPDASPGRRRYGQCY